jgi:hypothetical protein
MLPVSFVSVCESVTRWLFSDLTSSFGMFLFANGICSCSAHQTVVGRIGGMFTNRCGAGSV